MSIRVVTDSNSDLPAEVLREYGIVVVPLYINIGTDSYVDGVEMSRKEFYEGLPSFKAHPTTSVPGPDATAAAIAARIASPESAPLSALAP